VVGRDAVVRAAAFCATLTALSFLRPGDRVSAANDDVLPSTMLWAWERPVDLRGVSADIGVAFLAQTITIEAGSVSVQSRRWPLKVSPGTSLSAVTRVEMPLSRALTHRETDRIAGAIAATAEYPQVVAVQIDFDATASQRDLYRHLIERVRGQLRPGMPLSITALASWCVGDRWVDDLPIDEAVPMMFDLGPVNEPYRRVAMDAATAHGLCRSSIGLSLGEPMPFVPGGRRVYVFNPDPWTPQLIDSARGLARGNGPS
jgi:hypothetical protein